MLFLMLILAAVLEIGGDAAIRHGLPNAGWRWLVVGAMILTAYGFAVNLNRAIDFGRVMGIYIAVFFIVSQVLSFVVFGRWPKTRRSCLRRSALDRSSWAPIHILATALTSW